jgi:class 3 adenylate cyclase
LGWEIGDPVALGKALGQAAASGEVPIADATLALVRSATEVESIGPLRCPGRGEPVAAYRVLLGQGRSLSTGCRSFWSAEPM